MKNLFDGILGLAVFAIYYGSIASCLILSIMNFAAGEIGSAFWFLIIAGVPFFNTGVLIVHFFF